MNDGLKLTGKTTIFRKDFDNRPAYSIGISKKKEDGTWANVYIPVSFRRGVEVGNRTKVDIKDAWPSCYEGKNGTVLTIFVNDFDTEASDIPSGFSVCDDDELPFG